jgi:D-3-phosphoglycerate dehydrogenase
MKILITDKLANEAVDMLSKNHEVTFDEMDPSTLKNEITPYHALVVRSRTKVTKDILAKADNLKVIGRAGVGVDNIDIAEASNKKIKVVNSPTGATQSVAELTIGHMLSLSRKLTTADSTMKKGMWAKKELKGKELHGKTLGLIGLGNIGQQVATIATSFGMNILVYDPYCTTETAKRIGAILCDKNDLIKKADFISLHLPHTKETHHIIDQKALKMMKPTAYLINCARGGVVDDNALIDALNKNQISGAAMDVFEQEPPTGKILETKNIVLTPHLGASTAEGQIRAGTICAEQVLMTLDGKEPQFWVNKHLF